MRHIEHDYLNLLKDILNNGVEKNTRNGKTLSVFGRQIKHNMSKGFPLLTTKKMYFKGIITELLWFLRGDTNIKYLVDNNCNIWNGDAYQTYLNKFIGYDDVPDINWFINEIKINNYFTKIHGDLGPIYGKQWRSWERNATREEKITNPGVYKIHIDQIQNAINLLKTNPDDRGIIVSAWNVGELDQMTLRPCHNFFQFYTRELSHQERLDIACKGDENGIMPVVPMYKEKEKMVEFMNEKNIPTRGISLMWNQRSVDTPLGLPFNIASYALLLLMLAKQVNMAPDELIGNLGDTHIYLNQVDGIKEQLTRKPYHLPNVHISDVKVNDISDYTLDDISLINYKAHPKIKLPLSN